MASFKKRYDAQQKKNALGMLKELADRIRKDELKVETHGFWKGTEGSWNFRVVAKESEKS